MSPLIEQRIRQRPPRLHQVRHFHREATLQFHQSRGLDSRGLFGSDGRRRALAAFHLFELSAWIYQQILLSHLEKIEPEIDLLLGRLRSQLRQAQLAFKELLSFGLAWILANSGHAAEAAMLGNAAVHGAQIGLAERLARVRRTAAALIERAYGSPDAYRLNQGSRQRPEDGVSVSCVPNGGRALSMLIFQQR
ncbi:hypothetical protein F1559_000540 [Cyanidiococcus yangmingshanensis]|uniref:Uncharacterized protein n=1 Tax=Cyanidiococcus yangmingshanensis TaxID=2690220 RepID=A0A7J7IK52_9RHOD|nr:hypothetical protein F1559_000540 [Cyanidiococcus yangmingshanensis]